MKKVLHTTTLVSALTLSILNPANNWDVQAQTLTSTNKITYVAPKVEEKPGEPTGRRRGGGSRGSCKQYETLTALVPITKTENKQLVWGQSASQTPTFWFLVPDKLTPKLPVEFVIQDEADNYIYHTKFNPPETEAGIFRLPVQPTKPLLAGKSYRWTFSIYCDPDKPSNAVYVQGSMTQVALNSSSQQQLAAAKTPLEKAIFFAEHGIWYDALTSLGENLQNPKNKDPKILSAWSELLKQVNLD
ncbi:DUF928 domain-containing protein [Nostoc sp. FACHB-152]|uniref:DUF928 domain-containing protein n=1 Tax=unclassified Nostoc TaxID=2593658 RepID=UPI001682EF73|nr:MULTISPECIES: DUF928 domain-containing protein [unclassified Nostoc]MBD2450739.1 DUF928 domain-containing protein [Nostoc sp. FACHB-152]MBD2471951.1 DUF928 domain-containing protein [Nostoc sp. FACHB-145]